MTTAGADATNQQQTGWQRTGASVRKFGRMVRRVLTNAGATAVIGASLGFLATFLSSRESGETQLQAQRLALKASVDAERRQAAGSAYFDFLAQVETFQRFLEVSQPCSALGGDGLKSQPCRSLGRDASISIFDLKKAADRVAVYGSAQARDHAETIVAQAESVSGAISRADNLRVEQDRLEKLVDGAPPLEQPGLQREADAKDAELEAAVDVLATIHPTTVIDTEQQALLTLARAELDTTAG